jgi:hypothetical protein
METTRLVLGEDASSDEDPQDSIQSARMTSTGLSQLIATLGTVCEQIRDSEHGNDVKCLRYVAHRHHLK